MAGRGRVPGQPLGCSVERRGSGGLFVVSKSIWAFFPWLWTWLPMLQVVLFHHGYSLSGDGVYAVE